MRLLFCSLLGLAPVLAAPSLAAQESPPAAGSPSADGTTAPDDTPAVTALEAQTQDNSVEQTEPSAVANATDTSKVALPAAPAPSAEGPADAPPPLATLAVVPSVEAPKPEAFVKAQFGKGATIGTSDETFTVNIRARIQVQAAYIDAADEAVNDTTQVQVRRARLVFQGNIYGPQLTYYLQLAFSNRDTESDVRLPLRDAYFTYAPHDSANLRFGQMKVPYGRQRVVSSSAQGMVDRSIVVAELNLDRDVGAQMFSKDLFGLNEKLGYALGVFGGDGRNRVATNAGYLYVGRLVLTPFGSFDENVEADTGREDRPRLSVAVGAARNQATNRPQSTIGTPYSNRTVFFDYTHFAADFMFKYKGFFASGEWLYRKADDAVVRVGQSDGEAEDFYSRDAWGAYGQLGQMLTDHFEISARYGHLKPIGETDPALSLTHELGGGLSYYFERHDLKVQTDYFYLAKNNQLERGDHQVRLQSQVYF